MSNMYVPEQEYPITPAQEQEIRESARRIWDGKGVRGIVDPESKIRYVASILGCSVFKGGRLSSNVSFQTRCRIAQEEKPKG